MRVVCSTDFRASLPHGEESRSRGMSWQKSGSSKFKKIDHRTLLVGRLLRDLSHKGHMQERNRIETCQAIDTVTRAKTLS
jgi:hypothetical protein